MTTTSLSQSYPQTYGGDNFYQGPPRPPEAYLTQPPYQGCYSGPSGPTFLWDGPKTHGSAPKQPGGAHGLSFCFVFLLFFFIFKHSQLMCTCFWDFPLLCQCSRWTSLMMVLAGGAAAVVKAWVNQCWQPVVRPCVVVVFGTC